jgi:hypothetical protein
MPTRLTARIGQFAGQDLYGAQHYAASFIFEPMGYALGNLFSTLEMFDPPSTPALAQCGLEKAACVPALRRVRACSPLYLIPSLASWYR